MCNYLARIETFVWYLPSVVSKVIKNLLYMAMDSKELNQLQRWETHFPQKHIFSFPYVS